MNDRSHDPQSRRLDWPLAVCDGGRARGAGWLRCLAAALLTLGMFVALPFAELVNRKPLEKQAVHTVQTLILDEQPPPPPQWQMPEPQQPERDALRPQPQLLAPPAATLPSANLDVVPELDVGGFKGDFSLDFSRLPRPSAPAGDTAGSGPGTWSLAAVDRPPVPLARAKPIYPYRARQRGVEGVVELEFEVTEAGDVRAPRVLNAEPPGMFESAALQAVRRWRFEPARKDGEAVPVRVRINLRFDLQ